MKTIFVILCLLTLSGTCQEGRPQSAQTKIQYTEQTRGTAYIISISSSILHVKKTGLDAFEQSRTTPDKAWKKLRAMVKDLDLSELQHYEATTNQMATDRAAIAGIEIEQDGQVYSSADFDAGNPPEALKELVSYILELANPVE